MIITIVLSPTDIGVAVAEFLERRNMKLNGDLNYKAITDAQKKTHYGLECRVTIADNPPPSGSSAAKV